MTLLAEQNAEEAMSRWTTDHPDLKSRFPEELERASQLIGLYPEIGKRTRSRRVPAVLRIRMQRRVPYYIYYHRREEPFTHIEVVAVWHVRRGVPPT